MLTTRMLSSYVVVGATVVVLEPLLLATAAAMAARQVHGPVEQVDQ